MGVPDLSPAFIMGAIRVEVDEAVTTFPSSMNQAIG